MVRIELAAALLSAAGLFFWAWRYRRKHNLPLNEVAITLTVISTVAASLIVAFLAVPSIFLTVFVLSTDNTTVAYYNNKGVLTDAKIFGTDIASILVADVPGTVALVVAAFFVVRNVMRQKLEFTAEHEPPKSWLSGSLVKFRRTEIAVQKRRT